MGLFGKKEPGEPIAALMGYKVAAAHVLEGVLTVKLLGKGGEVILDVPGRCQLEDKKGSVGNEASAFGKALESLVGAKVRRAAIERGKAIWLDLGPSVLAISLREGEYPGLHALQVKGPGRVYASYHCDGMTQLTV